MWVWNTRTFILTKICWDIMMPVMRRTWNNCRLMENKSHLSRDKWLLFYNTRHFLSGRRDCGRCTRPQAEGTCGGWGCATDPTRGIPPCSPWTCARRHARRCEGNKSGPAPCGHRKQPVICKNFPCFILLLYRYKGTKKPRKDRIFSLENVTISDI